MSQISDMSIFPQGDHGPDGPIGLPGVRGPQVPQYFLNAPVLRFLHYD